MEERRAQRRHSTGLVAQHPIVKTTIDNGDNVEQRVIEDVDECKDKVDLFMGKDPERRKEWIANNIDFSHKEDYFEEVKRSEKAN
jgi:DNA gyrase/topoisomerase IV subunit B